MARACEVLFGDVHQLAGRLLPAFDVATLFRLVAFGSERNAACRAMTDRQLSSSYWASSCRASD